MEALPQRSWRDFLEDWVLENAHKHQKSGQKRKSVPVASGDQDELVDEVSNLDEELYRYNDTDPVDNDFYEPDFDTDLPIPTPDAPADDTPSMFACLQPATQAILHRPVHTIRETIEKIADYFALEYLKPGFDEDLQVCDAQSLFIFDQACRKLQELRERFLQRALDRMTGLGISTQFVQLFQVADSMVWHSNYIGGQTFCAGSLILTPREQLSFLVLRFQPEAVHSVRGVHHAEWGYPIRKDLQRWMTGIFLLHKIMAVFKRIVGEYMPVQTKSGGNLALAEQIDQYMLQSRNQLIRSCWLATAIILDDLLGMVYRES